LPVITRDHQNHFYLFFTLTQRNHIGTIASYHSGPSEPFLFIFYTDPTEPHWNHCQLSLRAIRTISIYFLHRTNRTTLEPLPVITRDHQSHFYLFFAQNQRNHIGTIASYHSGPSEPFPFIFCTEITEPPCNH
jgi:hypothetical protein